ncbi:MAG TPA: lipoyl(octanoyl) transferase LipB [Polyangiaceae bacterium]|nr:lipoyl(octanoyl) transferase LipB [Polyangiaceae bacterium]
MTDRRVLRGFWLGRQRYAAVHELQNALQAARSAGRIGDSVLFVEHEPVITLGRRGGGVQAAHVLVSRDALAARGIELFVTERGGDVTLHAPGQLVCYPIVDLSPDRCDVRRYVRDLTETMRRLILPLGVSGGMLDAFIGLWVDRAATHAWPGAESARDLAKIGAVGVHLSRWVTKHGFALNLHTDLDLFRLIVPCGISAHGVTSLFELTQQHVDVPALIPSALEILADVLGAESREIRDESRSLPAMSAFFA